MKIIFEKNSEPHLTFEEFADENDLVMTIRGHEDNYIARFDETEVMKNDSIILTTFGVGKTPTEAIDDYAGKIECRKLVRLPWSDEAYYVFAPKFKRINGKYFERPV